MENFTVLSERELTEVDGGAFEIMIAGKVLTGAAAFGVAGLAVAGLAGVAALGFYVASQN